MLLAPPPHTPRTILAHLGEKQRAVADVIAGRASLAEAAARFRDADTDGGGPAGDGEARGREVIGWVHLALRDCPERADMVAARLERELLIASPEN